MRTLLLTAVVLVASVVVSAVHAQDDAKKDRPRQPDPGDLFDRLDANGDGFVTENEIPEDRRRLLGRVLKAGDKNEDGKLTKEEFVAGLRAGRDRPDQQRPGAGTDRRPDAPRRFDPEAAFKRFDSNGDGKIDKDDEVPDTARRFIERADADKDGAVTKEEFLKLRPARTDRPAPARPGRGIDSVFFRALDADGDGTISSEEIANAAAALKKLDRNGDGALTVAEAGSAGRPDAPRATDRRPGANFDLKRLLATLDKNEDGKVSKDEARGQMKENFDRIDADGDGQLTAEELQRAFSRLRQRGEPRTDQARPGGDQKPPAKDK